MTTRRGRFAVALVADEPLPLFASDAGKRWRAVVDSVVEQDRIALLLVEREHAGRIIG